MSLAIDRMPDEEEAIIARRLAELRTGIDSTLHGIKLSPNGPISDR